MSFDSEKIIPPGATIKVFGIGGGGGNAVNTMINSKLEGVEFIAANTDVQALRHALTDQKIQLGKELTKGLGAGADPDVGRDAALEDRHEIQEMLAGADMVFVTAGMGGGTGTGGAAVVSQIARELGALTVGVVTKPFHFEGKRRRRHAELGIERLRESVDTLIVIPNQRLLQIATPDLSMVDAFNMADEVLVNAVKGISDIINVPGTVNVDFADVKTVMSSMGMALMGIGRSVGENRAIEAARQAILSPLLEDIDIEGATGILINITAGANVSLMEVNEACSIIQDAAHEDANIIFGAVIDENIGEEIQVTVIATGFPSDYEDEQDSNPLQTKKSNFAPKNIMQRPAYSQSAFRSSIVKDRPSSDSKPIAANPMPPSTDTAVARQNVNDDVNSSNEAEELTELTLNSFSGDTPQPAQSSNESSEDQTNPTDNNELNASKNHTESFEPTSPKQDSNVDQSDFTKETNVYGATVKDIPALTDELADAVKPESFEEPEPAEMTTVDSEADTPELAPKTSEDPPPMEALFDEEPTNEPTSFASDFDRKIDEALKLAERIRSNQTVSSEQDDLDLPAFLRQNNDDISLD